MFALRVYLFGPPRIEHNHTALEIQRRKTLGLFVYLIVTGQPHSRDKLAALFWPDTDQAGARANLRRDISRLRKALGEQALVLEGNNVSWNPEFGLWLDIQEFQSQTRKAASHDHPDGTPCVDCAGALAAAVNLYTDDFLAGFSLSDSSEFDDWQFFLAEELRRSLADTLESLIDRYIASGDYAQAIPYARRRLAIDELHEPAHQTLMRLYAWTGEQASALRQYGECARLLRERLKLAPDEETRLLYEAIKSKQLRPPEKTLVEGQPVVLPVLKGFPQEVSTFIGREGEVSAIEDLLQRPDVRLVTIVALGGMGKTRLSVEAARRFLEHHPALAPDGSAFLSLACVDDPGNLPLALAKELGLSLGGQLDPLTELVHALEPRGMLLVLDNFEQLVEGAPLLQDLLSRCPKLKMLVTSRVPLQLSFEWRVDLDGLPWPLPGAAGGDDLEAVRLFMQCAGQVRPGFSLDDVSRPQVHRLCAEVAGMPLAIKLAAGWLRLMTIGQILAEVERSLDILTSRMRDIPDRQRSMNAVFESTWDMLSSEEQRAFAALSVFRGGFSGEAAREVADVSPYLLSGLVDHGLVRFLSADRYEIHELTRQFCAYRLKENSQGSALVRRRHSAYYLDLLGKNGPAVYGLAPGDALQVLKNDLANIHVAWEWAVENLPLEDLKPAIQPLTDFYEIAGYLPAGEQAFGFAVRKYENAAVQPAGRSALFTLLVHYALFLVLEGRCTEAEGHIPKIEALVEALGDELSLADSCQIKGMAWHYGGRKAEAEELFRKAVGIYRHQDTPRCLVYALNHLGDCLSYLLQPLEALRCHEEALEISRRIGERRMEALSLSYMGISYYFVDRFDQAIRCWVQAADSFEQVGDVRARGLTLNNLGHISNHLGDYAGAVRYGEEALAILARVGDRFNEANAGDTLGEAYFALGQYEKARQSYEKAIQLSLDTERGGSDPAAFHTNLARLDIALGCYAEAEEHLEQAALLRVAGGHPKDVSRFLSVFARLYEQTGRREQALQSLDRGIALLQDAGDELQRGDLLVQKASLLLDAGDPVKAESVLDEALTIVREESRWPARFDAQLLSAKILYANGAGKEAIRRLQDLHETPRTGAQHAAIHYERWRFTGRADFAQIAREHYRRLAATTPDIGYQERLKELEAALKKAE